MNKINSPKNCLQLAALFLTLTLGVRTSFAQEKPAEKAPEASKDTSAKSADEKAKEGSVLLPEVVVTATRARESTQNIPQSITVVNKETIKRKQALTPNEVLAEESGIWSVKVPAQGSPIIRGQIGNRVVYLWDGIRINNGSLFSGPNPNFNQFPLGAIDRMEVIRGPGSVQYGSDAIGGVINIISKSQDEFPTESKSGGEVYPRYGTTNAETTETADFYTANRNFNVMGGLTNQNVGNYTTPGNDTVASTSFQARGGYLNTAYSPLKDQSIKLSAIYGDRENVDSYVQSKLNANGIARIFSPHEKRGLAKLEYKIENLGGQDGEMKAYSYYQSYDQARERRVQTATDFNNTKTGAQQNVWGGGVQYASPWLDTSLKQKIITGIDYRMEGLKATQSLDDTTIATGNTVTTVPAGKVPDGTYDVADIFATWEFHPLENLSTSIGGRLENTHLKANPNDLDVIPNAGYTIDDLRLDKTWLSQTWSIGTIYSFTPEWDLAANIATGFRAPTFSDTLSTGTPVFSSKIASLPSPGVGPEHSTTYEIGPRFHNQNWNASLTGYWTDLTDVIRSSPQGNVTIPGQGTFTAMRNSNDGKGYVRGVEAAASYKPFLDWTIFSNVTYTEGWDTNFHEYYRFIPPLNGTLGLRYENPTGQWWTEAVEVVVDRLRHHAPGDETDAGFSKDPGLGSPGATNPALADFEIDGYFLTNLRGGYRVWQGATTGDLTVAINNLFNVSYREAYSQQEIVAPGINVVVGGRFNF